MESNSTYIFKKQGRGQKAEGRGQKGRGFDLFVTFGCGWGAVCGVAIGETHLKTLAK